jgi:hypothetical protein
MGGGLRLDVHVGSFGIRRMPNSLAKDKPRLESAQVSAGGVLLVSARRARIERDPKQTQRPRIALFTRQDCFISLCAIITLAFILNLRSNSAKAIEVRAFDAYPA